MPQEQKREAKTKKLLFVEIIVDILVASAKFIVGLIGNSSAMLAEGFHSLADTTNQFFLLIGIQASKKQADQTHPFGYGKESFFWSFLAAMFILVVSAGMAFKKGIEQIISPEAISNFKISFFILGVGLVFQLVNLSLSSKRFLFGLKNLKQVLHKLKVTKEPTMVNLWLGDLAGVGGILLAGLSLFLVWRTGNVLYDGLASIIIGLVLAGLALFLIIDVKNLLIGEAVTPAMYEKIVDLIEEIKEVRTVINLKTMHLTPFEILVNADLEFEDNLTTEEIEAAIDNIEMLLKNEIPAIKQIYIEVESEPKKIYQKEL